MWRTKFFLLFLILSLPALAHEGLLGFDGKNILHYQVLDSDGVNEIQAIYVKETLTPEEEEKSRCQGGPRDWWLYEKDLTTEKVKKQKLTHICLDGYGAAGMGEDHFQINTAEGIWSHDQAGGSTWRWDFHREIDLLKLKPVRQESHGYWTMGSNIEQTSFDYTSQKSYRRWFSPSCEDKDSIDINDDAELSKVSYTHQPVLQMKKLPKEFVNEGWKTISLGQCSTTFNSKALPEKWYLNALASDQQELFIQFSIPQKESFSRLEIEYWSSPNLVGYSTQCFEKENLPTIRKWRINLLTGKVEPLGHNESLQAEVHYKDGTFDLKIKSTAKPYSPTDSNFGSFKFDILYALKTSPQTLERITTGQNNGPEHTQLTTTIRTEMGDSLSCVINKGNDLEMIFTPKSNEAGLFDNE